MNQHPSLLFTDLYELTMGQAYAAEALAAKSATFELFFRELPEGYGFMLVGGIDDAVDAILAARFTDADLDYLRRTTALDGDYIASLRDWRFTGDILAVREGDSVLPDEPMLQVVAPLGEAQLIETLALNAVMFPTLALTKAVRVVEAARGRTVVDFGSRRAHGRDAALTVARATYLAGGAGTSNLLAGQRDGIPTFGTMAHSYIEAHADEAAAFEAFTREHRHTTLLVDTYDTLTGIRRVIRLAQQLGDRFDVRAIRLDSGDLGTLAKQARRLLDEAGLTAVRIFASSGLDEHAIADLLADDAPIDGFGVGTKLAVVADSPSLDVAYKLVAIGDRPVMKLSSDKRTLPGRKQVFRTPRGDVLGAFGEDLPGQPMLRPVVRGGQRTEPRPTLDDVRAHIAATRDVRPRSVSVSNRLAALRNRIADQLRSDD